MTGFSLPGLADEHLARLRRTIIALVADEDSVVPLTVVKRLGHED